jgi:hypothetical protein
MNTTNSSPKTHKNHICAWLPVFHTSCIIVTTSLEQWASLMLSVLIETQFNFVSKLHPNSVWIRLSRAHLLKIEIMLRTYAHAHIHVCVLVCIGIYKQVNSHSACQEIPLLLWNEKVHYRVNKSQQMIPILSQMHPVHNIQPSFLKIHFNIILPSMPRSSEWSVLLRISIQNFVCTSHLIPLIWSL